MGLLNAFLTLFGYKDKNKIAFAVQTIIFFTVSIPPHTK